MTTQHLGLILHGITGRMGMNQHLIRSIVAIRDQGGVVLSNGDRVVPDPILVGRNIDKLNRLAQEYDIQRVSTDLDAALENESDTVFFDAGMTHMRDSLLRKAIAKGKHIYCEKPVAVSLEEAVATYKLAKSAGVKHGAVQDKLYLPGLMKLRRLRDSGFFGKMLSIRSEFGYWVFDGENIPAQRPSWNYRKKDGGGIIVDMLCHWRYVLDQVFSPVRSVSCMGATHIDRRWDENDKEYVADADDAAYATFELENGAIAQFNSSWCTRVRRDDLVTFHVDGTKGSAVAGLHRCFSQSFVNTPKPTWNPDIPQAINFFDNWDEVPDLADNDNGFKVQWEKFIRHVVEDGPWEHDLLEGAKGIQLAELGLQSWKERRWLDVPDLGA